MKRNIGVGLFALLLVVALLTPMAAMAQPPDNPVSGGWFICFTTSGNLITALDCVRWAVAHGIYEITIVAW